MKVFTEVQRFRQWWIWLIVAFIIATTAVSIVLSLRMTGSGTIDYVQVAFLVISTVFIISFLLLIRLETRIDETGIYYKFFPVHLKARKIEWSTIDSLTVIEYRPMDYGGWGMRNSFRKGRALSISGNVGLQLVFVNGKKLLIGTQKAKEMNMILKDLGKI
jgi:hypothetical protein